PVRACPLCTETGSVSRSAPDRAAAFAWRWNFRTAPETTGMMRTLVIDDEPLAREKVLRHLASHGDVEIVGECGHGDSAVEAIRDLRPDLLFLDIHLPECDAFEVLRRAGVRRHPAVIFITAYDEYALRAFDVQALDYLVKPFDDERYRSALQRGREQLDRVR